MSIGYDSRVVLYNRTGGEAGESVTWYGTELTKVRVELTKAASISSLGSADANTCTFKIYDSDLPDGYLSPSDWTNAADRSGRYTFTEDSFIVITKKPDIGAAYTAQTGTIADTDNGLIEDIQAEWSYVFKISTIDHYSLIPHWVIGAK